METDVCSLFHILNSASLSESIWEPNPDIVQTTGKQRCKHSCLILPFQTVSVSPSKKKKDLLRKMRVVNESFESLVSGGWWAGCFHRRTICPCTCVSLGVSSKRGEAVLFPFCPAVFAHNWSDRWRDGATGGGQKTPGSSPAQLTANIWEDSTERAVSQLVSNIITLSFTLKL